jgi:hypothetical protein
MTDICNAKMRQSWAHSCQQKKIQFSSVLWQNLLFSVNSNRILNIYSYETFTEKMQKSCQLAAPKNICRKFCLTGKKQNTSLALLMVGLS